MSTCSYIIEAGGNRVGGVDGVSEDQRWLPWRKGMCAGPGWFVQGLSPSPPLLCSALCLWPLAPEDLSVSSPCYWLPAGFLTWRPWQESGSKGGARCFSITASGRNSGSSHISALTAPSTKQANRGPASARPVTSAHDVIPYPSRGFLLTPLYVLTFFHLVFSALPSAVQPIPGLNSLCSKA